MYKKPKNLDKSAFSVNIDKRATRALLAAILLGAAPAYADDLSTPTLGADSAYTLTKVDAAGENTVTKFEYNSTTGEFTPVYYRVDLKQTEYGNSNGNTTLTFGWQMNADDTTEFVQNPITPIGQTITYKYNLSTDSQPTGEYTTKYINKESVLNVTDRGMSGNHHKLTGGISGITDFENVLFQDNSTKASLIVNHKSSYVDVRGGALNNSNSIDNLSGAFINNTITSSVHKNYTNNYGAYIYAYGGALYNSGDITDMNADFINNSVSGYTSRDEEDTWGYGGAIYNTGKIGNITGDFISNHATTWGGAIQNKGEIGDITGNFIGNQAGYVGGAIYNEGIMGNITGNFIGNSVGSYGGAIYNEHDGIIGNIVGNFIGNSAYNYSAAICNYGQVDDITGDFIRNLGEEGGAIYNTNKTGNIVGDFIANNADDGGAIYNEGTINNITGSFVENTAKQGGAIDNAGYITITDSTFENNYSSKYSGGAINNYFGAYDQVGENPNQPISLALYSDGEDSQEFQPNLTIKNTTFNNNTSASSGGAIFSGYEYNLEKYTGGAEPPRYESLMLMSETVTEATPATYAETPVISIENSSFQNNIANYGDGGAISFYYSDNIQTYLGQSSPGQPGSLVLADSGISLLSETGDSSDEILGEYQKTSNFLSIKNSEFVGNKSALGGAISFSYNKVETNIAEEPPAEPVSLLTEETEPEYKLVLENTSFANNSVALPEGYTPSEYGDNPIPQGGAIFADNGNSIFSNNTVTANGVTQKNDIYIVSNTNSTINVTPDENNWDMVPSIDATQEKFNPVTLSLEAKNNGTISFDGTIDGEATYSKAVLDENGHNGNWYDYFETEKLDTPYAYNLDIKGDETGRVVFNNDVKNANVTVADTNVYFGTRDNIFDGNNLELKSGMLSMVNDAAGVSALNTFTVTGDTQFVADVDLANQSMDRITADTYGEHTGNLNVVGMNLLSDAPETRDTTEILFADTGLMDNVVNGTGELPDAFQTAYTPIYKYNVGYETREDDGGYFVFTRGDRIPSITDPDEPDIPIIPDYTGRWRRFNRQPV